jgi:GNAT superfamily N-acetyltransferase
VSDQQVEVRLAEPGDRDEIMGVAARALGWAGDERDRALFEWKHDENTFGRSPAWVATLAGEVVGFRTFLCWELERGEERLRLARAVDTATDPAAQGQGIFRTLTLHSVDALTELGFDAIFNTPNDQSRPGYLKMGWEQLGRPTLGVVPRSPRSLARMLRSRVPAERWSVPTPVGVPAVEAVDGLRAVPHRADDERWSTPRSLDHLRWRYSLEPLHYRAIEVRGGLCIFRVRRRGASLEAAVTEWLSTEADPSALHRLVRAAGDYAVGVGLGWRRHRALPLPSQGPIVTWRQLQRSTAPRLDEIDFSLGDLELF